MNLVKGSTEKTVYVTTFEGIDKINTSERTFRTIGSVPDGDPLAFSQPRTSYLDPINQRVLVGDSDYESILAVDLSTGSRQLVLSNNVGSGVKMVAIRDIAVNSGETKAYVLDDGGNASEKVIEITLKNGDRRVLGDVNDTYNIRGSGIELDEDNEVVYAATSEAVYRIDLMVGSTKVLAVAETHQGEIFESISAIALDADSDRLYLSDAQLAKVVALNVEEMTTELVSGAGRGSGEGFAGINGLVYDDEEELLYASNQASGSIHQVNLANGNREVIANACVSSYYDDSDMIMEMSYDSETNDLLLLGDGVARVGVEEDSCHHQMYGFLMSIEPLSNNHLLGSDGGTLQMINEETGESVVISR